MTAQKAFKNMNGFDILRNLKACGASPAQL